MFFFKINIKYPRNNVMQPNIKPFKNKRDLDKEYFSKLKKSMKSTSFFEKASIKLLCIKLCIAEEYCSIKKGKSESR